ncbi:alkylmercury lyase [Marinithermus hydrothermalis]|uniref:Alkylmercury lyase n=1 Tax=Marinithermus hydrothermalis (strain DSM 14884 / JCM 11576 / T1) TaxID=869210 RepID=F2NN10_MARHT|nr:alkylmercury lyase [Marinithermus hydrothermalis]AEB12749.1 alkylmercury lyase [Marinithermus hydrothermalis DSM 14884]
MMHKPLDPEFAARLHRIYRLARPPTTPADFGALLRERNRTDPARRAFFEQVQAGHAVIGACTQARGYRLDLPDGATIQVMCAYDALMTALLRGRGEVRAECPHCGAPTHLVIEAHALTRATPDTAVFWWGSGPQDAPGNPICDHLHLFPSPEHLEAWLESRPDERGVALPIREAVAWLRALY